MIKVEELSKTIGSQAILAEMSFAVTPGEHLALIGLRGSGKSVLLQILCGFTPPSTGEVWIDGQSLRRHPCQAKQQIGYIPREAPLYPEQTVRSYLDLCHKLRGLPSDIQRTEELMDAFVLRAYADTRLDQLSRGLCQQLNLAQAVLHKPSILLMDDMFLDLDILESQRLQRLLTLHSQERTYLLATHDLNLASQLCQRVLILDQGRIVFDGPSQTVHEAGFFESFFAEREALDASSSSPVAP